MILSSLFLASSGVEGASTIEAPTRPVLFEREKLVPFSCESRAACVAFSSAKFVGLIAYGKVCRWPFARDTSRLLDCNVAIV